MADKTVDEAPVETGMTAMEHPLALLRFLQDNRESLSPLLILTHDYPDPDALAAAFGLSYLAKERFDIECRIRYGGVIGRAENRAMVKVLEIPIRRVSKRDLQRYRNVVLVDTQPRFENNSFPGNRKATIVIDQHASNVKPSADLALVDTGCGATCVVVAKAIMAAGLEIPERVGTALAYGIMTDTLDLVRARREDVVATYVAVLSKCDIRALAEIRTPARPKNFFITLGRGVREAAVFRNVIVSHLGKIENPDLVSQLAELLLTYQNAAWSLVTGRYHGRLHVSLRTNAPRADAGEILRQIVDNPKDAGGHGSIAGGAFRVGKDPAEEAWREAERGLEVRLLRRLRLPRRAEMRKLFRDPAAG